MFPQMLGLGTEKNLKPKIAFLRSRLSEQDLKEFVLYQPSLLAYSLDKRIRPRVEAMEKLSISLAYSPPYLMCLTDQKFEHWLSNQSDSWSAS
mmetsp:Transcript_23671/g.40149  ORF Transcript_23671/g.40149 Transcript_23671/m.40149 type:complete len:93 (+) Transcript_23671:3-281(+)